MSWCWFKPASAVPRRGGMNTVDHVPTYFGTEVNVRGASPAAGGLIKLERHKSFIMHSYAKRACKPIGICSYAIVGLKVPWNEYLQKKAGGGSVARKSAQHRLNLANARKRFRYNGRVERVTAGESG